MKDQLQRIIEYYLSSSDFNGMPASSLTESEMYEVQRLIQNGMVEAIANVENPHIKMFNQHASIENQLKYVTDIDSGACLYPTALALVETPKDPAKKYTSLLQSGFGQYEVRYFKVEVLEPYFNNPQYMIYDYGYRGSIIPKNNATEVEDMIKDYGLAYPREGGHVDRAVAVFLHDLAALSAPSQKKWESYEHANQIRWGVNANFTKNLILGEWTTTVWIYDAILMEQRIVNDICDAIGIKHIFTRTWNVDNWERPDGFSTILFPTRKNFYSFVEVLEKVVCNNISSKAFTDEQQYTRPVLACEEGTLTILGKWLLENGRNAELVDAKIVAPLKHIRRIRQIPAHQFYENEYDKQIYEEQNKVIEEAFWAVHCLRIMLSSHPRARSIQAPEYLEDESRIAIY